MIDLDAGDVGTALLRQAVHWKIRRDDGSLQLVHLDQLGTQHRRHLLAWLRANAALMQAHEARAIARQHKAGRLDDASFAAAMRPLETLAPRCGSTTPRSSGGSSRSPRPHPRPRHGGGDSCRGGSDEPAPGRPR